MKNFFIFLMLGVLITATYLMLRAPLENERITNSSFEEQRPDYEEDYGDLPVENTSYVTGLERINHDIQTFFQNVKQRLGVN